MNSLGSVPSPLHFTPRRPPLGHDSTHLFSIDYFLFAFLIIKVIFPTRF
uniref:Uncharacterized protein n=1 Tax=Heterorhabditis bacteriophora TaxID=37862 RepID=A0A1I7WLT9_HETBA